MKATTTVSIDVEVLKQAREAGLTISHVCEAALKKAVK